MQSLKPRKLRKAPKILFPGGYIQIVNPRHPISEVWSDILHLEPNCSLPAHTHERSSSLLICIKGRGVVGVNGQALDLRMGLCVFIPKGVEHYVKAARGSALDCLSINQGIIKPGAATDIVLHNGSSGDEKDVWYTFADACATAAERFQHEMKKSGRRWGSFLLDL
jgi:mannose-6-phosphate isomerase-like protein (cupin superfamily)